MKYSMNKIWETWNQQKLEIYLCKQTILLLELLHLHNTGIQQLNI